MLSALLSLALLPWVLGAQFEVTVGGPGVLKFDPPFVVRVSRSYIMGFTASQLLLAF